MVDINIIFNNTIVNNCFIIFCDFLVTSIENLYRQTLLAYHYYQNMFEDVSVTTGNII